MHNDILDYVLLPLADLFEAGKLNLWCTLKPGDVGEYEKFRECMAELVAEGSVIRSVAGTSSFRRLATRNTFLASACFAP